MIKLSASSDGDVTLTKREARELLGISRTHFSRLESECFLMPNFQPARGKKRYTLFYIKRAKIRLGQINSEFVKAFSKLGER